MKTQLEIDRIHFSFFRRPNFHNCMTPEDIYFFRILEDRRLADENRCLAEQTKILDDYAEILN